MGRRFLLCAAVSALVALALGCNSAMEPPPGGTPAVAYWHKVLLQYPDLPEKVRAIVEKHRSPDWMHELPQSEVHIYGADEVVSVHGRHVDVIVTDLDDDTLRKLLAWWEQVPRLAKELGVDYPLPFSLPESTRHIVVLGREGHIAVSGPGGSEVQSIHILSNDVAGRTTIGVHAFGPEGDAAVEQLTQQARQIRGPPRADLRAGHIALPPPEDNVSVLVIGRLKNLDIAGPSGDAQQDITFADYLNQHLDTDSVTGVLAGTPFAAAPEYVAELEAPQADPSPNEAIEFVEPVAVQPIVATPVAIEPVRAEPVAIQPIQVPVYIPQTPVLQIPPTQLPQTEFRPIHVPPVIVVPVHVQPVVIPRFGS